MSTTFRTTSLIVYIRLQFVLKTTKGKKCSVQIVIRFEKKNVGYCTIMFEMDTSFTFQKRKLSFHQMVLSDKYSYLKN